MTTLSSRMLQQQNDLMRILKNSVLLADSIHSANIAIDITDFII